MNTLLCYNNFLYRYDNFSFQEKVIPKELIPKVQITITAVEKNTEVSKVILEMTVPLPLAALLFILFIPVIIAVSFVVLIVSLPVFLFSMLKNRDTEVSYLEAKEYFNSGKGYLNNLSEKDKEKILTKNENIPLGL
jgi:hypothetical protein